MPPRNTRTPSTSNGSPLSPPPGNGARPNPASTTSPLAMSSPHHLRRPPADNQVLKKVQSLSTDDQRIFLAHDFEKVSKKPTKLRYYNIIHLFKPDSPRKPTDLKDLLKDDFIKQIRPILKPYILPAPIVSMDTDQEADFDPLGRRTTRQMLVKAIERKSTETTIPASANIDDVLILYKHYVDCDLKLPTNQRFIARPRTVPIQRLKGESIEDILLALRYYCPCLFVRSLAMNKDTLMDIYIQFIHDERPHSPLIPGYHYTILALGPSDFDIDTKVEGQFQSSLFFFFHTGKQDSAEQLTSRFLSYSHQFSGR
ncbi:uncharacterized protein MELLADRAFT_67628 [Melampsora larici-populina 98AG31]|uniref:Uncharacterized protein n=1 Tax=Melampsora larici-populina (strain 98AG31 / pathotype 3-4-7) TaxID=747676 RepID=F4S3V2_MELLP|nr:uncharacterized protein MELLADRAFT_67628 [Melampsora larici-populina 98AG31]EGG00600.1 hypothetical protein MELLADRAFT_67628 [Melampsora larici-populina 98AG31]